MPHLAIDPHHARRRLDVEDEVRVLGVFGTAHGSRLIAPVRHALAAATAAGRPVALLHIGPDPDATRAAFAGYRVIADGVLPPDEVSRRLSAVDLYLAAFVDGVSTRRGSWLAAVQHGLACVGSVGINTDPVFQAAAADGTFVGVDAADPHGFDRPVVELLADPARRAGDACGYPSPA